MELVGCLTGHKGCINNVVFDSNGVYCMTCGNDRTIRLWNPMKLLPIKMYSGPHNHEVNAVSISSDNSKFVSGGAETNAFIWDVIEGNVINKFVGHSGKITSVLYSANDNVVITGSSDTRVNVWDNRSFNKKPIQTFTDSKDSISSLESSSHEIISGSIDGRVRIYDLRKGMVVTDDFVEAVTSVTLTRDKEHLVVSVLGGSIHFLEKSTGEVLNTFKGHVHKDFRINSLLDGECKYIYSASEDGKICYWPLLGGEMIFQRAHKGPVMCVRFSMRDFIKDGVLQTDIDLQAKEAIETGKQLMVSVGSDGVLKVWNTSKERSV